MSHETILVVDDNPDNLLLIELLLARESFRVRTADGGRNALQALAAAVPDAMLTDIQMPDLDGLELIRLVRIDPRTRGMLILAVSANAMKEDIQEAYAAGCDGYITKPLDTRTFAAQVREQVERGRNSETIRPEAAADTLLLHGAFLVDCRKQIEALIGVRSISVRRKQASGILHRCAGTAGVLGHAHITALARDLEAQSPAYEEQEFVRGLRRLADLIENVPLPEKARAK